MKCAETAAATVVAMAEAAAAGVAAAAEGGTSEAAKAESLRREEHDCNAVAPASTKVEGKRKLSRSDTELNELTEGLAVGEDTEHQKDRPGRSSARLDC